MASQIAFSVVNAVVGIGSIGAGLGFGAAENAKMTELNEKAAKLKEDAEAAGDIYDHTYYLVTENLKRVKTAINALPDDFLTQVDDDINNVVKSASQDALTLLGQILGYVGGGAATISAIIKTVRAYKAKRAANSEPEPTIDEDPANPWKGVPVEPAEAQPTEAQPAEAVDTIGASTLTNRLLLGLDVATTVFALGGLGLTVGLGIWTLDKLDDAIEEVEKKQKEVDEFKAAMTSVLNDMLDKAGLQDKTYEELQAMAETWKEISVHYEGYSKQLKFAIQYYYMGLTFDAIKEKVDKISDEGLEPFPDDAYALAKTLADGIKDLIDQGKTDTEIVDFYATDNPELSLRFVLDEYFLSVLRYM